MAQLIFESNALPNCFPGIESVKIAKIFACGELNLLSFEQVNLVVPGMKGFDATKKKLKRDHCKVYLIFSN